MKNLKRFDIIDGPDVSLLMEMINKPSAELEFTIRIEEGNFICPVHFYHSDTNIINDAQRVMIKGNVLLDTDTKIPTTVSFEYMEKAGALIFRSEKEKDLEELLDSLELKRDE